MCRYYILLHKFITTVCIYTSFYNLFLKVFWQYEPNTTQLMVQVYEKVCGVSEIVRIDHEIV